MSSPSPMMMNNMKSPSPSKPNNQSGHEQQQPTPAATATTTQTTMIIPDSILANDITDWLKRAQIATNKRDEAINRVSRLVASGDQSAQDLQDSVSSIVHQQLPNLVPSVASVAEQVSQSARVAEGSYKKATTIDQSLRRVNDSLEITRAVLKMRSSLTAMQTALNGGDIEGASAAVAEYDETSRRLKGRESLLMQYDTSSNSNNANNTDKQQHIETQSVGSTSDDTMTDISTTTDSLDSSSFIHVNTSNKKQQQHGAAFVQDTRQKVHDAAMAQLEKARSSNNSNNNSDEDSGADEKTLRSCVIVLARLSYVEDAEKTFSEFTARKNVAELNKIADKKHIEEARTMRGASHLELVARLLDHTVGCLEEQEGFVTEYLGGKMKNFMLTLHNRSAALCVEVLKDFLEQRKLSNNNNSQSARNNKSSSSSSMQQQQQQQDPATIDQQLEDLARLLVCCSTYFQYLIDRLCEEDTSLSERDARQLVRQNNELATSVENLMAIFVPLQIDYFDAAYSVALADTASNLDSFRKVFFARLGGSSSSSKGSSSSSGSSSTTGFFQSMAAALGGNNNNNNSSSKNNNNSDNNTNNKPAHQLFSGETEEDLMNRFINSSDGTFILPEIDMVQDIFYVCRNAIHRVMGTKATAIASSTLIVINNLLSDKLLSDVRKNIDENLANLSSSSSNSEATFCLLAALIWTAALSAISKDSKQLADETGRLSEKFFKDNHDELLRFSEQRLDFVQTAATSDDIIDHVCKNIGNEIFKLCGGVRGDMKGVSFILEKKFVVVADNNNNNNNNNGSDNNNNTTTKNQQNIAIDWVEPLTERFEAVLANVTPPVAPWSDSVRCTIVASFLDCVTIEIEQTVWTKRFDLAGALKFDQDLRQLRNFFSTEIDLDIPVREKFKRLNSVTSVLLSERKADAQVAANVLNSTDISNLLKLRIDPPAS